MKVESCGRAGREHFSPQSFQAQRIIIICLATALSPVHNFSFSLPGRGIFPHLQVRADSNCPLLPARGSHCNNPAQNKWPCAVISSFLLPSRSRWGGFVISRKRIPRVAHKQGQGHPNKGNRIVCIVPIKTPPGWVRSLLFGEAVPGHILRWLMLERPRWALWGRGNYLALPGMQSCDARGPALLPMASWGCFGSSSCGWLQRHHLPPSLGIAPAAKI